MLQDHEGLREDVFDPKVRSSMPQGLWPLAVVVTARIDSFGLCRPEKAVHFE